MYYVYGIYDPGCNCCNSNYTYEEFSDEREAQREAVRLELDDYSVTIVCGAEIEIDEEIRAKAICEKEIAKAEKEKKKRQNELEDKRRQLVELKRELGES